MDHNRSKQANIIITNRIIPCLNERDLKTLKACIFEQFGFKTEADWICRSLTAMMRDMTIDMSREIERRAVQLGQSQSQEMENNMRISICQSIDKRYSDYLSRLHSDIIDEMGKHYK